MRIAVDYIQITRTDKELITVILRLAVILADIYCTDSTAISCKMRVDNMLVHCTYVLCA